MDFIAAKHAAARDIALALGVPPMLLGIPGDNTFANYQEAQRSFWRQTVLPLVVRMSKAFSAWLAPAYGGGIVLRPDLDQVEGLSGEREALWARINAATFLTLDEKRAAVGYGPAPLLRAAEETAPSFGGEEVPFVKYSPDQPRVSAGNTDGGQWTDGGGGGSPSRGSARDASSEGESRLAQARGVRRPQSRALMRFPEATAAQEVRLMVAEESARALLDELSARDPNWKPTPSLTSTIEGAISAAEAETREARERLLEIDSEGAIPRAKTLKELGTSEGRLVWKKSKGGGVDTVTVPGEEFRRMLRELPRDAVEIEAPPRYNGVWYRRHDGTTIGIRRSEKHGLTIDLIDTLGDPLLGKKLRIHSDD
jgi:hypothetical protein